MKRFIALLMVCTCLLAFVGCNKKEDNSSVAKTEVKEQVKEEKAETIVLRYGCVNPETHPLVMGIKKFAEIVDEKSEGRIQIDIYPNSQLGDKKTQIQSLQLGALDFFMTKPSVLVDYKVDEMKVLGLPYLYRDLEHGRSVLDSSIGDSLLDSIQQAGTKMIGVGFYLESPRNFFFTDKEVRTIKDMEGLKLRVPNGSMYVDMVKAFGASPTPIAYSELYSALQTGVVDGAENPVSGYYNNRFYEISKYYTLDGHDMSPNITIMSEMVWNTLSLEDQKLIREAFNESKPYFNDLSGEKDKEALEQLEANGVKIIEVDDPNEWQEAVKPLYEQYGAGYNELIQQIKAYDK